MEKATAQTEETTSGTSEGYLSRYGGGGISVEEEELTGISTRIPEGMVRPSAPTGQIFETPELSSRAQDYITSLGIGQFGAQKIKIAQVQPVKPESKVDMFLGSIVGNENKAGVLNIPRTRQSNRQDTYFINDVILGQRNVNAQTQEQFNKQQQEQQQDQITDIIGLQITQEIPIQNITPFNPLPTPVPQRTPPPPPGFSLNNQGTGSGPSGGGSIGISKFTERLNIVTSRQALIGDRINTMTGLGRQTIKQNKKNRLF